VTFEGDFKGLKPETEDSGDSADGSSVKYEMMYDYSDEMNKEAERIIIAKDEDEIKTKEKRKSVRKFERIAARERDPNEEDKVEGFFRGLFDFFDSVFRGFLGMEPLDKTDRPSTKSKINANVGAEKRTEMAL